MSASSVGRHRGLLLLVPFAVAVALRIYPYLVYGVPYSTDSWSPIRNTQELLAHTPTTLGGNHVFDGYNIYWPANSLFGAVASLVLNVAPIKIMPLLFPLIGASTVVIFFLVAERVTGSPVVASMAALFLAASGFDAIFTAGVTKETYALPLFMLSMLLLLWKTDWKSGTLFAIASVTMALSHHATAVVFLAVAASILFVDSILLKRRGEPIGKKPLLFVIGAAITLIDIVVYSGAGLTQFGTQGFLTLQNVILALAFLAVFVTPIAYHSLSRPTKVLFAEGALVLGLALAVLAIGTRAAVIPLAPTVTSTLLVSAVPYALLGILAIFGYRVMHLAKERRNFVFLASWLASVLAFGFLALFSSVPDGLALIARLLTFIAPPALILASLALQKALGRAGQRGALKVLVVLVILGIAIPSAFQTYQASIQKESLLGGQWAYQPSDLVGAQWISASSGTGYVAVAGDTRMQHILTDYLGVNVDVVAGYLYLANPHQIVRPEYLVTYSLMKTNGYVLFLYGMPLPDDWAITLQKNSPLVYSNGNFVVW